MSVLQGRLGGLARLQVRLRLEARPPLLLPGSARRRHLLPRPQRARERAGADNSPNTSQNDVVYNAGHVSDTWKINGRLTLNLGVRFERYVDSFPDQSFTPNGHAARQTGRRTSTSPSARAT
ncbi:MAG: hypothetical protein R2712_10945 [Vicinamibacterales bacterium]